MKLQKWALLVAANIHYHILLRTSPGMLVQMERDNYRKEMKDPKVTEMGKGNGKGRKHPEAAVRMNFLHQAAACVLKSTGNKVKLNQMILFIIPIASEIASHDFIHHSQ